MIWIILLFSPVILVAALFWLMVLVQIGVLIEDVLTKSNKGFMP